MALTGTYTRTLDQKRRLAVPRQLRDEFDEKDLSCLYVAPGTEKSLAMFSPTGFQRLAERIANQSRNRPDVRNYQRLFYSRAEKVNLDSQGRIRLPDRLVDLAELKHDVVLLGVHDHAEIWDRVNWEDFLQHQEPSFDEIASTAFEP